MFEKSTDDDKMQAVPNTFELINSVEKEIEVNRARVNSLHSTDNAVFPIEIWELIGTNMTYKEQCTTLTSICKTLTHMVYSKPCPYTVLKLKNIMNSYGYKLLTLTLIKTPDRWINIKRIVNLCRKDKYTCIVIANLFPNLEIFDDTFNNNEYNDNLKQEMKIDDATLAYVAMKCQNIKHVRLNIRSHAYSVEPQEANRETPTKLTDFTVNKLTIAGISQIVKSQSFEDFETSGRRVDLDIKALGFLRCTQCRKLFNPNNNTDTSCLYHTGVYSGYGSSCSSYNCCGSMAPPYPCSQGCKISRHTTEGKEFQSAVFGRCVPEDSAFETYTNSIADEWSKLRELRDEQSNCVTFL
jgi:hypothetical protein